jgi:hypothetical protein
MVIIDFPYGKLVKTMMFNIYQENTTNIKHGFFTNLSYGKSIITNNGKSSVFTLMVYMVNL